MLKELSIRQNEMIEDLSRGYTVKEIAARKFISPYTVDTHLKTSKKKTGARTLAHLSAIFIKSSIAMLFLAIQLSITFDLDSSEKNVRTRVRTSRTSRCSRNRNKTRNKWTS